MNNKICSKCKIDKPVTSFHKSKNEPCGYKSRCKDCRNLDNRNRRIDAKIKKELNKVEVKDPRMNPIERTCKTCNITKLLEDFNKSCRHKLGRMYECKVCRNLTAIKRKENPETRKKDNLKNVEWKRVNSDKVKASNKRYSIKNSERIKESGRLYRKNNPEKRKETCKRYNDNNPDILAKKRTIRRIKEKQSIPRWSESSKIKTVYKKAKELGELTGMIYHVDHIIPLNHPKVCGLHVWANLQILEASLNCSKQNKLENIKVIYEEES